MTKEQQLAALYNRATRYEIAAIHGDQKILVLYTSQHSRSGLLKAARQHGLELIKVLGITGTDMLIPAKKASAGFSLGSWQIRFTGRTQREAICEGELPFVCDLAREMVAAV